MQTNITAGDPSTSSFPRSELPAGNSTVSGQGQSAFSLPSDPNGQIRPDSVEIKAALAEQLSLADLEEVTQDSDFNATFEQILAMGDAELPEQSRFGVSEEAQVNIEPERPTASDVAFQMVFTQITNGNGDPGATAIDLDMLPSALASPAMSAMSELNALSELNTLSELDALPELTATDVASSMFTADGSPEGFVLPDQTAELEIDLAPAVPDENAPPPINHTISQRDEISTALPAGVSPKEVTQVVTDKLVQQIQLTENGEQKQLILQLHPAELGQVTLQVDWENESLKVKIVANEMVATDILNQNKSELVSALAEQGIDFDSLDVAYERAQPDQQEDEDANRARSLSPDLFSDTAEEEVTAQAVPNDSSSLDITV